MQAGDESPGAVRSVHRQNHIGARAAGMHHTEKRVNNLAEHLGFNRWNIHQINAIDLFGIFFKKIFMAVNLYPNAARDQSFCQFFGKRFISTINVRIPPGSNDGNGHSR
jgi:hypothetical protein